MMLFKKSERMDCTVPHTESYRGYKRIKLASYRDEVAHKGIKKLGTLSISYIGFQLIKGQPGINVYADGNRIGTIWKDSWASYYKAIKDGQVKAGHVEIADADTVYLYVCI